MKKHLVFNSLGHMIYGMCWVLFLFYKEIGIPRLIGYFIVVIGVIIYVIISFTSFEYLKSFIKKHESNEIQPQSTQEP